MSCKFTTWVIKIEHINLVSETLLQSPTEVAGAILFDNDGMFSSNIIFNSSGKNDSVNITFDDYIVQLQNIHIQQLHISKQDVFMVIRQVMTFVNLYAYPWKVH